jgi:hypothetical protein
MSSKPWIEIEVLIKTPNITASYSKYCIFVFGSGRFSLILDAAVPVLKPVPNQ